MAIQTTNGALTKPPTAMASHNTSNKLIKMIKKIYKLKAKHLYNNHIFKNVILLFWNKDIYSHCTLPPQLLAAYTRLPRLKGNAKRKWRKYNQKHENLLPTHARVTNSATCGANSNKRRKKESLLSAAFPSVCLSLPTANLHSCLFVCSSFFAQLPHSSAPS